MIKKSIIIILLLVVFSSITYAVNCEDVTSPEEIPCIVITPMMNCLNYTYNLTNLQTNNTIVTDGNLKIYNSSVYYFNFTQTNGSYLIEVCDGSTAVIDVTYEEGYALLISFIIASSIFLFLIIAGYNYRNAWMLICAGILGYVIGAFLYINQINGINNDLRNYFIIIIIGISIYLSIFPFLKILNGEWI